MHELSICRAIASTATDHARGRRVERVELAIGHFRQIVPSTLQYCWELHTRDTELHGCVLEVDHLPAIAHCTQCDHDTTLTQPIIRCGQCEAPAQLVQGEEFLVRAIDVAEPAIAGRPTIPDPSHPTSHAGDR